MQMTQIRAFLAQIVTYSALTLALASSPTAFSADFQSPRTMALGGAGRASPLLNDAIYLNPSFVSFLPTSSVAANFTRLDGSGRNANVSILDGRSEMFQAGVGYTLQEDRRMIHFGGSKSLLERYGIGLSGKFILPNGESPNSIWESQVSFTAIPGDAVHLALIIDNLQESAAARKAGFLREFTLGSKVSLDKIVLLYFDPHWTPHAESRYGYEAGAEFPFLSDIFLRMGQFKNSWLSSWNVRGQGYSVGLGWIAPKISFDFAIQRVTAPVVTRATTLGTTIYF
jgi:hypothetical protein